MKQALCSDPEEAAAKRVVPGVAQRSLAEMLNPAGPRRQPLAGFDDDYLDIVDYIVRCTHRIWEEGQRHLILTHYTPECALHTLGGEIRGADTVVTNTVATLRAFPDRELLPENVIWSGNDRDGFYTSHRILSPMTNLGDSDFGPATGRRCEVRTIADCRVKANRIFEEWLVRDNRALVQQLGFDPVGVAAAQAKADRTRPRDAWTWLEAELERVRRRRALATPASGTVLADARERFERLWEGQPAAGALYAVDCRVSGPGGRQFLGAAAAASLVREVQSGLSDLHLTVDHLAAIPYRDVGCDLAIRWCLAGLHTGSYLVPATNASVLILGVTHWRLVGEHVAEEWTVFDEIAVLRQMLRQRAARD